MKVLGIRYCTVTPHAREWAAMLDALGLPARSMDDVTLPPSEEGFSGAIFLTGEHSWVELWRPGPEMPEGTMLQVIVDDAEAFAEHARDHGLSPEGPMDLYGERIYFLKAPGGGQVSFQSRWPLSAG